MFNIIEILTVLIGTLVGAGFASGKEIYLFFSQYGKEGLVGIILTVVMIYLTIYYTIVITKRFNINNNMEFIKVISKNIIIRNILRNTIIIFLIISFWVMCAGIATFFKEKLEIPIIISLVINSIIVYCLLEKNIEGIMNFNIVVVPVMILIIIIIATNKYQLIKINEINTELNRNLGAIIKAILYTSYNSITLIPIVISISSKVKNKKNSRIITFITSIIILILLLVIYKILIFSPIDIKNKELPILSIVENFSKKQTILYSIVIVIAMLTSAISALFGVIENIKSKKKHKNIIIFLCLLSIPISYIGFSNLIEIVYPVFGIIGIIEVILILKRGMSIAKKHKN